MPDRMIRESICISETLNQLTDFEERFWHRLIVNCDDFGRFYAIPAILKSRLFPLLDGKTKKDMQNALNKLASVGLVDLYEVDGKPFLQVVTWEKYQRRRAEKSKFPSPDGSCCQLTTDVPDNRESIIENRKAEIDNRESDNAASGSAQRADYAKIVAMYNEICVSYPRCSKLSEKRKQAISARISSGYTLDDFQTVFRKAEESHFLKGGNDRNWRADFDWMIKDANMAKIFEGKYDDIPIVSGTSHKTGNIFSKLMMEGVTDETE